MINQYISAYFIFYASLFIGGLLFIRESYFKSLLLYTGVLVIFSPSISPQYWTIPVALISTYPNIFYLLFTIIGFTDFTFLSVDELHLTQYRSLIPSKILSDLTTYRGAGDWMVGMLSLGFLWMFVARPIKIFLKDTLYLLLNPQKIKV